MKIKTFFLLCLLAFIATHAYAYEYDFEVDGFQYLITSTTDLTVNIVRGPDFQVVTVPSTVVFNKRTFRVTGIDSWAFSNSVDLESVDMPSITDIPEGTFWNCSHLTHVNMPAVKHIGAGAFYSCPSLPSVDVPVATSIGDSAFYDCEALTSLSMPAATSIGESAFYRRSGKILWVMIFEENGCEQSSAPDVALGLSPAGNGLRASSRLADRTYPHSFGMKPAHKRKLSFGHRIASLRSHKIHSALLAF